MKAVIFDMDGVLVDSERYFYQLKTDFLRQAGEEPGVDNITEIVGLSADNGWEKLVPTAEKRAVLRPQFEDYRHSHMIDYAEYLNDNVAEFLADLVNDGRQVALASAGYLTGINQMLRQCELGQYFNMVMSGDQVANNKPAPDIYQASLQQLGLTAADCVAVEDSPVGIQAAKSAGLETWAVRYPYYQLDQSQADQVLTGFGEIRKYYRKNHRKMG